MIAAGSGSPASTESASLIASTRCFIPRAAEPADAPDDAGRAATWITPSAGVGDVKAVAAARTPPAGGGAAAVCTSAGASASGGAAGVPAARPHSPLELPLNASLFAPDAKPRASGERGAANESGDATAAASATSASHSRWPLRRATAAASSPKALLLPGAAPRSSSTFTTSRWPSCAAVSRLVLP